MGEADSSACKNCAPGIPCTIPPRTGHMDSWEDIVSKALPQIAVVQQEPGIPDCGVIVMTIANAVHFAHHNRTVFSRIVCPTLTDSMLRKEVLCQIADKKEFSASGVTIGQLKRFYDTSVPKIFIGVGEASERATTVTVKQQIAVQHIPDYIDDLKLPLIMELVNIPPWFRNLSKRELQVVKGVEGVLEHEPEKPPFPYAGTTTDAEGTARAIVTSSLSKAVDPTCHPIGEELRQTWNVPLGNHFLSITACKKIGDGDHIVQLLSSWGERWGHNGRIRVRLGKISTSKLFDMDLKVHAPQVKANPSLV
uniref:Pept_C1 domain-containing protein n=1 Tax=Steinernema glaseri TaxID=37863 RepID=A0A1I7Z8T6_9BILA